MAIIFPSDPVLDEEFTAEGKTWYWSGEKWAFASTSAETISAASPITYSASTQIIGINQTLLSVEQSQVSNLTTSLSSKAPLDSPGLTGTPTAPTATAGANTTQVATTQFVSTAVLNIIGAAPETLNTLNELAEALGDDANFATSVTSSLGLKAPIASPTFTGTTTVPTLSLTTSDTTTTATHYMVETATDGVVRPKTLANTRTEIVTTAAVNSAAATTVGTVTSGTWQGSVISGTYIDSAIARLASPTFTGTPAAPTAASGTSTTQVATTAFVTTKTNEIQAQLNDIEAIAILGL